MNFYLKQMVFTIGDRFTIYDEEGNDRYYVEGEVFTFGKKLHLLDLDGKELAFISQKIFTWLPKYEIYQGESMIAEVVKEFSFFHPFYSVYLENGDRLSISGDFFDHDYVVEDASRMLASVSKEWFTWGDAYCISVADGVDPVLALSIVLVIDACIEAQQRS